jgi:hypothetical protein
MMLIVALIFALNFALKRRAVLPVLCGAALCMLLGGGCVETTGPLTDASSAKVDTDLLGTWTGTTTSGEAATVTFGRGDTDGVMTEDEIDIDPQKGTTNPIARKFFTVSILNSHNYLNYDDSTSEKPTYYISQYSISGDMLDVWTGDSNVENDLIQQGVLIGTTSDVDPRADPSSLARYLTNNSGDDLFPESSLSMVLHRVNTPAAPTPPAASTPPVTPDTPPAPVTPTATDTSPPPAATVPPVQPVPPPAPGTASSTSLWLPVIIFVGIGGIIVLAGIAVGVVVYIAKKKPEE